MRHNLEKELITKVKCERKKAIKRDTNHVIEERRVLLPDLVLFIDDALLKAFLGRHLWLTPKSRATLAQCQEIREEERAPKFTSIASSTKLSLSTISSQEQITISA